MLRKGARGAEGEFDLEKKRGGGEGQGKCRGTGKRNVKREEWMGDESAEEGIVEWGEKCEGKFKCGEKRKVWVDKGTL